ncbi:hypothetical protein BBAD15_g7216 [Beauveria bassiana D1-5]|uniref:Uncharacterized protein n=1 Tax=Beauveria bassiana D1-5 TaxID=1245745 RepID=A0A0A2VHS8_BEABA|nr:hypothetical protein BBAD15_g7216 [Beauveria bassiana D1-5]
MWTVFFDKAPVLMFWKLCHGDTEVISDETARIIAGRDDNDEDEAAIAAAAAHDDPITDDDAAHNDKTDTSRNEPGGRDGQHQSALIQYITNCTSATFLNSLAASLGTRGLDGFRARMAVVNCLTIAFLRKPNWDVEMSTRMEWERSRGLGQNTLGKGPPVAVDKVWLYNSIPARAFEQETSWFKKF